MLIFDNDETTLLNSDYHVDQSTVHNFDLPIHKERRLRCLALIIEAHPDDAELEWAEPF